MCQYTLFAGMTPGELEASRSRILVSIIGHDEVMAAEVRAVHEYQTDDIVFDGRFTDVLQTTSEGDRVVDLTKFHDVEVPASSDSHVSRGQ